MEIGLEIQVKRRYVGKGHRREEIFEDGNVAPSRYLRVIRQFLKIFESFMPSSTAGSEIGLLASGRRPFCFTLRFKAAASKVNIETLFGGNSFLRRAMSACKTSFRVLLSGFVCSDCAKLAVFCSH